MVNGMTRGFKIIIQTVNGYRRWSDQCIVTQMTSCDIITNDVICILISSIILSLSIINIGRVRGLTLAWLPFHKVTLLQKITIRNVTKSTLPWQFWIPIRYAFYNIRMTTLILRWSSLLAVMHSIPSGEGRECMSTFLWKALLSLLVKAENTWL